MSDAAILTGNLTLLNRALAEIKAHVGQFLVNEKILLDTTPRVINLVENSTGSVQATAKILSGKLTALTTIQKSLETEAMNFISEASDFKTKIDTDPFYSFLKTPMRTWGLRQAQILGGLVKESMKYVGPASSISRRLLAQNKDVQNFVGEVESTEKAATGTGMLPKISQLLSGTVGTTAQAIFAPLKGALMPLAVIAGAAALMWVTKPGILKGRR